MRSVDAQSRRAAVLFEIAARADRYTADVAPETPGERMAGLLEVIDRLGWNDDPAVRLEAAGRLLEWIEHDAEIDAR